MSRFQFLLLGAFACCLTAASPSLAATVAGGGSRTSDCMLVMEIPGANKPAPPRAPKSVDCIDGDSTCDSDATRNGECVFPLQLCVNSTSLTTCSPNNADSAFVDHSVDDGMDRRFDTDFQALQSRVAGIGLPTGAPDRCTISSAITVKLVGPDSSNRMKKNRKTLKVTTNGATTGGVAKDVDKAVFTCRPEGDAIYLPTDLYDGTFDRIRKQVFAQSCALAGCHDSESHTGNLILLSGAAYANLVNVTPDNAPAAADLLKRVTPGDETTSLLYRKIAGSLPGNYGSPMPLDEPALDADLIELIRLWILGDGITGPAPETGWVAGTEQ